RMRVPAKKDGGDYAALLLAHQLAIPVWKVRGFGAAGKDDWNGRSRHDLREGVRVAERQVVEPELVRGGLADQKVRLAALDRYCWPVDESYPNTAVALGACRKLLRRVVLPCL